MSDALKIALKSTVSGVALVAQRQSGHPNNPRHAIVPRAQVPRKKLRKVTQVNTQAEAKRLQGLGVQEAVAEAICTYQYEHIKELNAALEDSEGALDSLQEQGTERVLDAIAKEREEIRQLDARLLQEIRHLKERLTRKLEKANDANVQLQVKIEGVTETVRSQPTTTQFLAILGLFLGVTVAVSSNLTHILGK